MGPILLKAIQHVSSQAHLALQHFDDADEIKKLEASRDRHNPLFTKFCHLVLGHLIGAEIAQMRPGCTLIDASRRITCSVGPSRLETRSAPTHIFDDPYIGQVNQCAMRLSEECLLLLQPHVRSLLSLD